ncbi:MAG: hypothetical protein ACI3V0_10005, partial [Faecousia sp.]
IISHKNPLSVSWYTVFRRNSGKNSGTKSFAKSGCFACFVLSPRPGENEPLKGIEFVWITSLQRQQQKIGKSQNSLSDVIADRGESQEPNKKMVSG